MKRHILALVTSLAVLALSTGSALAGTYVVDQSQTNVGTSIGGSDWIFAQTFTAGLYGQVESVDLYLFGQPATVTVSLQGVTGNPPVPDGTILGEKVVGVNSMDTGWVRFNFSSYPVVNPGQMYSIFIYAIGSTNAFYGSVADLYPGGQALEYRNSAWAPISVRLPGVLSDWAFRTNVDPILVPTPPARLVATPGPTSAPALTSPPTTIPAPTTAATVVPSTVAVAATATALSNSPSAPLGSGTNPGSGGSGSSGSSGSGGPNDLMLPILGVAVVLLGAGAGGLWFLFMRPSPPAG